MISSHSGATGDACVLIKLLYSELKPTREHGRQSAASSAGRPPTVGTAATGFLILGWLWGVGPQIGGPPPTPFPLRPVQELVHPQLPKDI